MAPAALALTADLDEDTVDFVPNYDEQLTQPGVLPAAYPNLLVNGTTGIAVGMATNMPPHNLVEVIGAARHLLTHPDASLDAIVTNPPFHQGFAKESADTLAMFSGARRVLRPGGELWCVFNSHLPWRRELERQ